MVDELRALVRREHEDALESERLHRLDADVAELRARADVISAFFAAERDEDERLRRAEDEAGADVARRDVAVQTLERAAEEHAAFEREATELAEELPRLERWANELAEGIPGGTALDTADLADWASHARAELFVAASQLDARRERAVLEANGIATALLGESTYGSTPDQALAQVERYRRSTPGQVSESR